MAHVPGVIDDITKILTEFALTKFPVKALEVIGPLSERKSYRWRITSTRYKEITVLAKTSGALFSKPGLKEISIYGTTHERTLKPNLEDLKAYLDIAELVPI
ncbi:MAG: hypothetical protein LLG44_10335 [Chloroflexi bacterium]|nr:hypothetical protein [Chloroflexota bacterium]